MTCTPEEILSAKYDSVSTEMFANAFHLMEARRPNLKDSYKFPLLFHQESLDYFRMNFVKLPSSCRNASTQTSSLMSMSLPNNLIVGSRLECKSLAIAVKKAFAPDHAEEVIQRVLAGTAEAERYLVEVSCFSDSWAELSKLLDDANGRRMALRSTFPVRTSKKQFRNYIGSVTG
jgi:hypothetical protein